MPAAPIVTAAAAPFSLSRSSVRPPWFERDDTRVCRGASECVGWLRVQSRGCVPVRLSRDGCKGPRRVLVVSWRLSIGLICNTKIVPFRWVYP